MSPELRRLTAADVRRVPWKNGRGVTEELALWPPGASFERGDFDWRVARAGVAEAGPFSEFPGFDRLLIVTEGEGLLLRHGAAAPVRVAPLAPHHFSGDDATSAELLKGPVSDVNVLARRGRVVAEAAVLAGAGCRRHPLGAGHVLLHVLQGGVSAGLAGRAARVTLAPRESLWMREPAPSDALELQGGECVALLLRLGPATS